MNSPSEVSQAISRHTGLGSIIHIGRDDALMHAALVKGQPGSALKPKSDFAKSYAQLVGLITAAPDALAEKRLARVLHIGRTRAAA
jgi:hypothetical protein